MGTDLTSLTQHIHELFYINRGSGIFEGAKVHIVGWDKKMEETLPQQGFQGAQAGHELTGRHIVTFLNGYVLLNLELVNVLENGQTLSH